MKNRAWRGAWLVLCATTVGLCRAQDEEEDDGALGDGVVIFFVFIVSLLAVGFIAGMLKIAIYGRAPAVETMAQKPGLSKGSKQPVQPSEFQKMILDDQAPLFGTPKITKPSSFTSLNGSKDMGASRSDSFSSFKDNSYAAPYQNHSPFNRLSIKAGAARFPSLGGARNRVSMGFNAFKTFVPGQNRNKRPPTPPQLRGGSYASKEDLEEEDDEFRLATLRRPNVSQFTLDSESVFSTMSKNSERSGQTSGFSNNVSRPPVDRPKHPRRMPARKDSNTARGPPRDQPTKPAKNRGPPHRERARRDRSKSPDPAKGKAPMRLSDFKTPKQKTVTRPRNDGRQQLQPRQGKGQGPRRPVPPAFQSKMSDVDLDLDV